MRQNCKLDVEKQSFWTAAPFYNTEIKPPFVVFEAGKIFARENYSASSDEETGYLLMYTLSGTGTVRCNEKQRQIGKDEAVVIDCKEHYEYACAESSDGSWVFCYVHFDGSGCVFYADYLDIYAKEKIYVSNRINITAYLDKLFSTLNHSDSYYRCLQTETLCRILTLLASEQLLIDHAENVSLSHTETIHNVAEEIDKNHWQPLTVEELAKAAGMSKYHFLRIFKEVMGVTPYKYMLMKRIEAAKKILKTTELSVYEVSMMVGFKDECHFSRTFKNITNTTPFRYKKSPPQ